MTKKVKVSKNVLALCSIKSDLAENLTREETKDLMSWCDCQTEDLWNEMTLQEILNVYRASGEYVTFELWAEDDWRAAYKAWNSAVIDDRNKLKPRD